MKRAKYTSEADLCADFIEFAQEHHYTVYPETAGFDMVLVDAAGHQIGVEAKLTLNLKVVQQALPSPYDSYNRRDVGPDHRAILAPTLGPEGLAEIADFMGLAIFSGSGRRLTGRNVYYGFNRYMAWYREMFDWNPAERLHLPEHVPTTRAGIPAKGYRRSASAIQLQRRQLQIRPCDNGFYSANKMAELLGVDDKTLGRWIAAGLLKAKRRGTNRTPEQGGDHWWIRERDVRAFAIEHPLRIDLAKIPALSRAWFIHLLAGRHAA